jgi:carbon storage regulator
MLILARKINESIMVGDQVEISIVDIKGDQVKLGINAPRSVKVYRREVYQLIQQENLEAARATPDLIPNLDTLAPKKPAEPEKK